MAHYRFLAVSRSLQPLAYHEFLQKCMSQPSYDPRIDVLLNNMVGAVESVLQLPPGCIQNRRGSTQEIGEQLGWLALYMLHLSHSDPKGQWHCSIYAHNCDQMTSDSSALTGSREEELARLVLILITPDPITGARSTSASASGHTHFKELAKDTLICALAALAQSSDAFSPLQSVAGGLMFFATLSDVSTHA